MSISALDLMAEAGCEVADNNTMLSGQDLFIMLSKAIRGTDQWWAKAVAFHIQKGTERTEFELLKKCKEVLND